MNKGRSLVVVSLLGFILLFTMLLLFLALSNPDIAITITKPLNQSYNYINHTINVTTSATASSCRYIVNGSSQGAVWQQIANPGWISETERYGIGTAISSNGTIWLTGGHGLSGTATTYNDVWYSTDGNTWTQATSDGGWSARYGHGFVIKSDDSMWIYGGYNNGVYFNDVWNSTNGVTWTLVNSSVAWENRSWGQAIITSDDVMWMMGGINASLSSSTKGDIWNSSNGIDWKLVNESAFPVRNNFSAVKGDNDRFWVFGGSDGSSTLNDAWYSDDKTNWLAPNTSAIPWTGRYGLASAYTPGDKRIWIIGGYVAIPEYKNDVWYTQDGSNWTQAASTNLWSGRQDHSVVVIPNGTMFIMGGYGFSGTDSLWKSPPPVDMDAGVPNGVKPWGKSFNASEGSNFIGVECNDSANWWNNTNVSFYVDTVLPIITISNPLNTTYNGTTYPVATNVTVSETASTCLSSLNGAANLTMNGSGTDWGITHTFAEGSNTIVVSCNDSVNNRNSTALAFTYDSIKPIINISSPLNVTYTTISLTANATTNESASICRYALNAHGIDENWTQLNSSAFVGRYGHSMINTSDGTMWIIGGAVGVEIVSYLNDVWNSTDGINWVQVTASAGFSARAYHTSVVDSTGRMWVIAGYDGTTYYNDTWYSTDGITWTRANASAFPARYGHSSVVDNNGKMWVIAGYITGAGADPPILSGEFSISAGGGGTPVTTNTTWYSTNGYAWIQANASAFPSRHSHTSVVSNDGKIWVIGGTYTVGAGTEAYYNDAWYSNDSASWVRATNSGEFGGRFRHASAATPDNRIWVFGGQDSGNNNFNDVWYSTNGSGWKLANSTSAWSARSQHSAMYLNNAIYLIGGRDAYTQGLNDTYKTTIPADYYNMDGSLTAWGKSFTAAQGNNDIKVRCWDVAGNLNSSMQWFYVDSQGPVITFSSPLNQSYTTASTDIGVSVSETASSCVYSLNGAANATMTFTGSKWSATATAANGGNTITVNCQDSLGNWGSSSVAFSASFAVCGNQVCESGETTASCPGDCPAAAATSAGGGGGGTPAKEQANFYDLKANVPVEKEFADEKTVLTKIEVTAKEDAKNVKMSIEKKEAIPEKAKAPAGKVYQILDIKLETEVEIKAEVCFAVDSEWLDEQDAQKEDVALAHYKPRIMYNLHPVSIEGNEMRVRFGAEQEDWEYLPTEIVKIEATKTEYCSETKAFSPYAIIAKNPEIKEFLTVIRPTIEEQILTGNAVKAPRTTDWWALREWIMGSIDVILVLFASILLLFGDRIFPQGINIPMPNIRLPSLPKIQMPSIPEIKIPSIESMIPAVPKPPELNLPETPLFPVELPKAPAKHELPAEYKRILVAFARDSLLKGYSESEIRKEMTNHYIAEESIDSIINQCRNKICAMTRYELLPHVIDLVMRGYSADYISKAYAKNEISSHCIESVIKLARREISAASRKSLLPFASKCLIKKMPVPEIITILVKHGVNKTAAEELVSKAHSLMKKQRHLK